MSQGTVPVNELPIHITSEIKRQNYVQFLVSVGDTDETRLRRYFEVRLPDDSHRVRAEWDTTTARDGQEFAFRLLVDDLEPRGVIYRDGDVYEEGVPEPVSVRQDSFLKDAAMRESLRPFWVFTQAGIDSAREVSDQLLTPVASADESGVTQWAGCEADFAGAGAGVGALAGSVAGPEGTAAGAAVGGVVGAAFGLGYCTAQAVCG